MIVTSATNPLMPLDHGDSTSHATHNAHVDSSHHCRACSKSVCNQHSMHRRAVPKRSHFEPVRVCDDCALKKGSEDQQLDEPLPLLRGTVDTLNALSDGIYTPCKNMVTGFVRPQYWEADEAVQVCGQHTNGGCKQEFDNEIITKHHCRACGKIFCDNCSNNYHQSELFTFAQRTCKSCHQEILARAPVHS